VIKAWETPPQEVDNHWSMLAARFKRLTDNYPQLLKTNNYQHLGTLGRVTILLKSAWMSSSACG
jgi:hypothetical protein